MSQSDLPPPAERAALNVFHDLELVYVRKKGEAPKRACRAEGVGKRPLGNSNASGAGAGTLGEQTFSHSLLGKTFTDST
jgi:hypothetical protein